MKLGNGQVMVYKQTNKQQKNIQDRKRANSKCHYVALPQQAGTSTENYIFLI